MALHINRNRDNSSELEHDDPDRLVPEWFAPTSSSVSSTPSSNLIWYSFN